MNKEVSLLGDGSGGAPEGRGWGAPIVYMYARGDGASSGYLDIHDSTCLNPIVIIVAAHWVSYKDDLRFTHT